jgi:hypothetical protein
MSIEFSAALTQYLYSKKRSAIRAETHRFDGNGAVQ